jgi:ATP-binding cassette subfamily B (MDR/TAP) protein 1
MSLREIYLLTAKISRNLISIKTYRSGLALVSQEPILYQGSIGDNILFGSEREDKADEEIQRACAEANIWDFKRSLP